MTSGAVVRTIAIFFPLSFAERLPNGVYSNEHYALTGKSAWKRRKERINWDDLFIMMTDRDFIPPVPSGGRANFCGEDVILAFSLLPYQNKVCLVKDPAYCQKYECCRQVISGTDDDCVGIITDMISLSGKRMYQYVKGWDYIKFLNKEL